MKKNLLIILTLCVVILTLISCNKNEPSDNSTATTTTVQITTTTTTTTTTKAKTLIYAPDDDYYEKYDVMGYIMTSWGTVEVHIGYDLSFQGHSIDSKPSNPKKIFDFNGIEYSLTYARGVRGAFEKNGIDTYYACPPDCDCQDHLIEKKYSYRVDYVRKTGQLVGIYVNEKTCYEGDDPCLDRISEVKEEYTKEELSAFAKEIAREYVDIFALDMNIDECTLIYKKNSDTKGDYYYFHKCIDGVPVNEYIRVDLNKFGKVMGVSAGGMGMYEEFENARIDLDAIKKLVPYYLSIVIYNEKGTLVAGLGCYQEGCEYEKYVPLVPEEIEYEE